MVAVENRYQTEYEKRLDPFQSFSQAERKRKYGQLSVAEKVILSLVRFIVSNKTARLMVTLYSILLHGLVFIVLYKMAMTESCKHDMAAKWHEKYIEHMQVGRNIRLKVSNSTSISISTAHIHVKMIKHRGRGVTLADLYFKIIGHD